MAKKISTAIIAILAICLGVCVLSGCQVTPSPTEVVSTTLDTVKSDGYGSLAESFKDGKLIVDGADSNGMSTSVSDTMTDEQKQVWNNFWSLMSDFDYEVKDETIDGDSATVKVSFTCHPCGQMVKDAMNSYIQKAFMLAFSRMGDVSEDESAALLCAEIKTQMDATTEKSYATTGTVTLSKEDGAWVIVDADTAFLNGVTGGVYSTLDNLNASFSSLSSSSNS